MTVNLNNIRCDVGFSLQVEDSGYFICQEQLELDSNSWILAGFLLAIGMLSLSGFIIYLAMHTISNISFSMLNSTLVIFVVGIIAIFISQLVYASTLNGTSYSFSWALYEIGVILSSIPYLAEHLPL